MFYKLVDIAQRGDLGVELFSLTSFLGEEQEEEEEFLLIKLSKKLALLYV